MDMFTVLVSCLFVANEKNLKKSEYYIDLA